MKRFLVLSFLLLAPAASAQDTPLVWASRLESSFRIVPNITYLTASGFDSKLDLYVTRTPRSRFRRSSGFTAADGPVARSESATGFQAYQEIGHERRQRRVTARARRPGAGRRRRLRRCALRWVIQHAKGWRRHVPHVVAGGSGRRPSRAHDWNASGSAGLDALCPGPDNPLPLS